MTAKFKALEAKWNKKLTEKGFKDVERVGGPGGVRVLKTSSNPFRNSESYAIAEVKSGYYLDIARALSGTKWDCKLDKKILTLYSEGVTIKEIARQVLRHRETVRMVIYKYEDRWKIKRHTT